MNREIKFRFWNTLNKTMSPSSYNLYDNSYLYEIDLLAATKFNLGNFFTLDGEEYEVGCDDIKHRIEIPLQYTGVKDIKRKEVYEGDVVTIGNNKNGVIKFHKCTFIIEPINFQFIAMGYFGNLDESLNDVKVIGNIYENPELLEEQYNDDRYN